MVTKQKAFNKILVHQNTQIFFMDEAHVKLLDPDDWKILTQGGLPLRVANTRNQTQRPWTPAFASSILEVSTLHHWQECSSHCRTTQWTALFGPAVSHALQMMRYPLRCPDPLQSRTNLTKRKRKDSESST